MAKKQGPTSGNKTPFGGEAIKKMREAQHKKGQELADNIVSKMKTAKPNSQSVDTTKLPRGPRKTNG